MSSDEDMKKLWSNVMNNGQPSSSASIAIDEEKAKLVEASSEATKVRDSSLDQPKLDDDGKNRTESTPALPMNEQYTWDVCFVFKVGDPTKTVTVFDEETKQKTKITQEEQFKQTTADIIQKIENCGLKTDLWFSVQKDEIYCRVGATEKRLQQEADRVDYDLQLDEDRCLEAGRMLDVALARVTEDATITDITPSAWHNLYGRYDQLDEKHVYRQELYKRYQDDELGIRNNSFFTSIDRIKLTVNMIEGDSQLGGAEISLTKCIADGDHSMIAFFPLHQNRKRQGLLTKFKEWRSAFEAPLNDIRSYFGEAIALYFAFLAYYNVALIAPAVLGFIFFIWQVSVGKVDVEAIPVYAILISIWATLFLELWKRSEARFRAKWGMSSFKEKEQPRPEFHGIWRASPIDGHKVEYFPWAQKIIRALVSQSVIWTLIMIVIASVVSIFVFRKVLVEWDPELGNIITAFINAIQIQILNFIYGIVSIKLNDYENHRTDTEYQNALIAKSFLFKFVNSYNSLFYIAFIKRSDSAVNGCKGDDCLAELQQQLGTIFITLIVVNNALEVGIPYLMSKINERMNRAETTGAERAQSGADFKEKSTPEQEFELAPYDGTFADFDELVIQYGYVTLFVVAFPLAPLLALINNVLEMRVDSFKLLTLTRRPEPRGAYDIGTWSDILSIVSYIAVIFNVGIICFETTLMKDWTKNDAATAAYVFIAAEHLIFLLKFAIAYFVPDEPQDITDHLARQDYIVNVLINGMEEEPDDAEERANRGAVHKKIEFDWNRVSDAIKFSEHAWR